MIIADTGYWLALANAADAHHAIALRVSRSLNEALVTTWPVVTETCHLLGARLGTDSLLAFVRSARAGVFEIRAIARQDLGRIEELMKKYEDLPMDLADASLVLLAEELGSGRILSTDARDFRTYRWKNHKPFRNLLLS